MLTKRQLYVPANRYLLTKILQFQQQPCFKTFCSGAKKQECINGAIKVEDLSWLEKQLKESSLHCTLSCTTQHFKQSFLFFGNSGWLAKESAFRKCSLFLPLNWVSFCFVSCILKRKKSCWKYSFFFTRGSCNVTIIIATVGHLETAR